MSQPIDPNDFQVTDLPEGTTVPNHRVRTEGQGPSFTGKLRRAMTGEPRDTKAKTPSLPREKKPVPPYREGMYIEPMEDFYTFLAMVLMPFRPAAAMYLSMPEILLDRETGETTEGKTGARKCAEAWDAAAKKSESVRRMLETFLQVSVWGTLVTVHIPLFIGLATPGDGGNMMQGLEEMLKRHAGSEQE